MTAVFKIKTNSPSKVRDEIVTYLDMMASSKRRQAIMANRVRVRDEHEHHASAYAAMATFLKEVMISPADVQVPAIENETHTSVTYAIRVQQYLDFEGTEPSWYCYTILKTGFKHIFFSGDQSMVEQNAAELRKLPARTVQLICGEGE